MILNTIFIIYILIGFILVFAFALFSFYEDRKFYKFTLYKTKYITRNKSFKKFIKINHDYSLLKRSIGYLVMGPFWILGILFVIIY